MDLTPLELLRTGAFGISVWPGGEVTFVEKDGRAASLIQANLEKTRLADRARLLRADVRQALDWLGREQKGFDLVFADPPYLKAEGGRRKAEGENQGSGFRVQGSESKSRNPESRIQNPESKLNWVGHLPNSPALGSLLAPEGLLLVEHFKKDIALDSPCFVLKRQFRFGDTTVSLFNTGGYRPCA